MKDSARSTTISYMLYIFGLPSGEYECITDVALFTMIRQMAGLYVHATHSLFYDAYLRRHILSSSEFGNGEEVEIAP